MAEMIYMKKLICFAIVLCFLMTGITGYSKSVRDISINYEYWEAEYITRLDVISYLMHAIGTPGGDISADYAYPQKFLYCDHEHSDRNTIWYEFSIRCQFTYVPDMPLIALQYTDIIYGDYTCEEHNGLKYIGYTRYATAEEILAFMIRCLDVNGVNMASLDETFKAAVDKGLVLETDTFYSNPKKNVTFEEFKPILQRFLQQERYLYFEGPNLIHYSKQNTGDTYAEFLTERYGEAYVDKLLSLTATGDWDY